MSSVIEQKKQGSHSVGFMSQTFPSIIGGITSCWTDQTQWYTSRWQFASFSLLSFETSCMGLFFTAPSCTWSFDKVLINWFVLFLLLSYWLYFFSSYFKGSFLFHVPLILCLGLFPILELILVLLFACFAWFYTFFSYWLFVLALDL